MHIKTDRFYCPREFPLHHFPASPPHPQATTDPIFMPQDSSVFWNSIKINDALFILVCLAFFLQCKVCKVHSCYRVYQCFLFIAEHLSILRIYHSLSVPCSLTHGLLIVLHCYESSHYAHLCTTLFTCGHMSSFLLDGDLAVELLTHKVQECLTF